MSTINRRQVLQGLGGALGAIGLSQLGLGRQAIRYGQALAQSTPRKVALLIGINDYRGNGLDGALNDVELQRRLLVHRFGFSEGDVHVLKDADACRQNILTAFNECLYEPAQAGDVVVLHFSGHGDRVRESALMRDFLNRIDRSCIDTSCLNTAIAPYRYDANAANGVQDIMGHTLLLMRAALAQKTDNVTFVLDCCYAGGGKRGNAVMRSLNQATARSGLRQIADTEWEYQRQLLDQLSWNDDQFVEAITSSRGQGFFVGAARYNQLAADYSFDGFVAGAFTYLLTQYLWQATGPLSVTIPMVANSSTRLAEHTQQPIYDPASTANPIVSQKPIYHIDPVSQPAEALVLGPSGNKAEGRLQLWLGGLDPWTLEAFDQGAIFSLIDATTGAELAEVQQIDGSRRGLVTDGQLVSTTRGLDSAAATGQLLQEKVRGISGTVTLKVGLDATLTPAEQQLALERLGQWPEFVTFPIQPGKVAHVLLGRYTEAIDRYLVAQAAPASLRQTVGSVGLFSPTQVPVLLGSFGAPGEPIEIAIDRLRPRFVSLYLGHMLALMVNQQTAHIDVSVLVKHGASRTGTTTRGGNPDAIIIPQQSDQGVAQIPMGDQITVEVHNNEAQNLHFGILAIDSAGQLTVLFPPGASDDPQIDVIASGGLRAIELRAAPPHGIAELLVLASPQSLVSPLKKLRSNAPRLDRSPNRGEEVDSVAAMDDLFGAMDTRRSGSTPSAGAGPRRLGVEDVAVLSLLFEIVP